MKTLKTFSLSLVIASVLPAGQPLAGSQLWTHTFNKDIWWHKVTDLGTLLVGTEDGIYSFNPETGQIAWQREDLKKTPEFNVEEIKGTPFLLVSQVEGKIKVKTKLYALNVLTGEAIWETDKVKGLGVDAVPVPSKGLVLLLTTPYTALKSELGLTALDLATGNVVWESELKQKVDLAIAEGSDKFFKKFDLSGHQPPVIERDAIYFTCAGLHKYDLNTGKLLWGQKYDITEKNLKRANAQPIIDGDIIYTSAKRKLKAIDKNTGQLKWESEKKFSGAVAEMAAVGDVIYGRMGGNFFDTMKQQWELKKPLGVVAVDKRTGELIWKYDKAKNGITNMVIREDLGTILIADARNLIGLDAHSKKKPREAFKEKLAFNLKIGLEGHKGGRLKGDMPVAISTREDGIAVVRGKQHLLAFDPRKRNIVWSVQYKAPGVSGWTKLAMGAVTAFAYAEASNRAAGSPRQNQWTNEDRWKALANYDQVAGQRFSAAADKYAYILTEIEEGNEKGAGVIGVNLDTGKGERQVLLNDEKPNYKVDEVAGRVFNVVKKKELIAFSVN